MSNGIIPGYSNAVSKTLIEESGVITVDTDLNQLRFHDDVTPGGVIINQPDYAYSPGLENLILNGDFSLWDNGTSQTTDGYLSANRWFTTNVGGGGFTLQRVADPDIHGEYVLQYDVIGGSNTDDINFIVQRINYIQVLLGKQVTLSFDARVTTGTGQVTAAAHLYTGVGGDPSLIWELGVEKIDLTTTFQRFSVTYTVPETEIVTLGSGVSYLAQRIIASDGTDGNPYSDDLGPKTQTVQIRRVKLQFGDTATPFIKRLPAIERMLCSYYTEILGVDGSNSLATQPGYGAFVSSTSFQTVYRYRQVKARIPSFSYLTGSATDFVVICNGTFLTVSALTFTQITKESVLITATVSGATSGQPGRLMSGAGVYPKILINGEI